jgi:hypothetical protein
MNIRNPTMMLSRTFASISKVFLAGLLLASVSAWAAGGYGPGSGGGTTSSGVLPGEDTSYAIEASHSCLSGGCHETSTQLLNDHANSLMTHAMVKCNACHGTHTAAQLGLPKPNLTGYYPGIGATGYVVGKDRCLTCHTAQLSKAGHPKNPGTCTGCHTPHVFGK